MGWGAQQWLKFTPESAYGTYDSAGTAFWIRLVDDTAFDMRSVVQRQIIRSADGGNRRRQLVSARKVVAGNLKTLFYPSQAATILGAALTLTSNDLKSYTIDYYDSVQGMRFLGAKVGSLTVSTDSSSDYASLSLGLVAQKRDTVSLAQPADTVFPTDTPFTHFESKGNVSIGGSTAVKYKSLSISVKNILDPTWDEDEWISSLLYCGRDVDVSIAMQYLSTTMRDDFESQSALAVSLAWARPSGVTATLDCQSTNYIAEVGDQLRLGAANYQTINIQTFYDQAGSTDCSFTVA